MARNFNVDDAALTARRSATGRRRSSARTSACSKSQQRNLLEQPSRHLMRLNIDMGGVESRRILERLVAEEQNDLLKG